jgi:hypothetical protein
MSRRSTAASFDKAGCRSYPTRTAARRLAGFGQRAATSGKTSSIKRRVWDSISSSPRAAGRIDRAALGGCSGADACDHRRDLVRGLGSGLPAGAKASGALLTSRRSTSADRVHRLWRDRGAGKPVVHALEIDCLFAPQASDYLQALIRLAGAVIPATTIVLLWR